MKILRHKSLSFGVVVANDAGFPAPPPSPPLQRSCILCFHIFEYRTRRSLEQQLQRQCHYLSLTFKQVNSNCSHFCNEDVNTTHFLRSILLFFHKRIKFNFKYEANSQQFNFTTVPTDHDAKFNASNQLSMHCSENTINTLSPTCFGTY